MSSCFRSDDELSPCQGLCGKLRADFNTLQWIIESNELTIFEGGITCVES